MKKIIIRMIGALCILAALATATFPTLVQIDGIKNRDLRTCREQLTSDLDNVRDLLVRRLGSGIGDRIKDDLKDNDLPYKASTVKKQIKETKDLLETLIDKDIALQEVILLAMKAPQYITDTENFLETSLVAEDVFENVEFANYEMVEEVIDNVEPFGFVFSAVVGFFFFVGALGVVAAVFHVLNKGRFVKYFFLPFFLLIVVGICVAVPIAPDLIQSELMLPEAAEDLELKTTAMPYLAIVLVMVPVVLDIIFERKKTNKVEA